MLDKIDLPGKEIERVRGGDLLSRSMHKGLCREKGANQLMASQEGDVPAIKEWVIWGP